jgi:hypothetical protein
MLVKEDIFNAGTVTEAGGAGTLDGAVKPRHPKLKTQRI